MSRTMGVPPPSAMAVATAAPSPEAPPVIRTLPSWRGSDMVIPPVLSGWIRDSADAGECCREAGRGTGGVERDSDGVRAPRAQERRLGQILRSVVAALHPD